jgi:hypothetical protein
MRRQLPREIHPYIYTHCPTNAPTQPQQEREREKERERETQEIFFLRPNLEIFSNRPLWTTYIPKYKVAVSGVAVKQRLILLCFSNSSESSPTGSQAP